MNPLDEFLCSVRILRFLYKVFDIDIFESKSYRLSAINIFWLIQSFSTVVGGVLGYLLFNDFVLEFMSIIGFFGFSMIFLKHVFIFDLRLLVDVIAFLADIFKKNSMKSAKYYDLCKTYSKFSVKIIKTVICAYVSFPICLSAPSVFRYYHGAALRTSLGVYVPFISDSQLFYWNVYVFIVTIVIVSSFDGIIYLVFVNISLPSNIIIDQIKELEHIIRGSELSEKESKFRLSQIIYMHQNYNK